MPCRERTIVVRNANAVFPRSIHRRSWFDKKKTIRTYLHAEIIASNVAKSITRIRKLEFTVITRECTKSLENKRHRLPTRVRTEHKTHFNIKTANPRCVEPRGRQKLGAKYRSPINIGICVHTYIYVYYHTIILR